MSNFIHQNIVKHVQLTSNSCSILFELSLKCFYDQFRFRCKPKLNSEGIFQSNFNAVIVSQIDFSN